MKNIILLFTLFFSLSAFGAAKFSRKGLEGWGKKGVKFGIEDYSDKYKNFPLKAIRTKVELRLLKEGIKATDKYTGQIILVNAQPVELASEFLHYSIRITARRIMKFKALDNTEKLVTYETFGTSRTYSGIATANRLIPFIDSLMDQFLLDYLKANPKKKE